MAMVLMRYLHAAALCGICLQSDKTDAAWNAAMERKYRQEGCRANTATNKTHRRVAGWVRG